MQQIVAITLYLLTILIPLVFTTSTSELFEFPKFLLLITGTLIISVSWIYYLYQTRDYKIKINTIGYGMLAVLSTTAISTIFSLHPYTSFWGYYGRFHGGLFSLICYTIIYFAATKWMDTKSTQKLIKISIKTSIFVAILAIFEHYGYSLSCVVINYANMIFSQVNNLTFNLSPSEWYSNACWSAATNPGNRSFSLLGQPNWLAAYLIPHLFLFLAKFRLNKHKHHKLYYYLGFVIFTLALLFTRSRSGFLAFALAYISYWFIEYRVYGLVKIKQSLTTISILSLATLLLFGTPYTPSLSSIFTKAQQSPAPSTQGTVLENGGTESGDIRKIVWTGAIKSISMHPLIGSGPETFAYTYYTVRGTEHNLTSEWDYLYNKAHNEYLNVAAGAGIVGLLAYLYLHFAIATTSLAKIEKSKKINQDQDDEIRHFYPVLGATIVSFFVTNFFGFSVIPVYFTLILFAAMSSTLNQSPNHNSFKIPLYFYFVIPLILTYPFSIYLSDKSYTLGKRYLDGGKVDKAIPLLQGAIKYRGGLDLFHATLGEAYALADQKELALQEVDINQKLNPAHLNFFRSRAKVYLTLSTSDPDYYKQAAQEIENARVLAPSDPKLAYNLGLIYTRTNQLQLAEKELKDAINLKPNYAEPYYALTLLYEQTKKLDKIPPLLSGAKSHLATYSAQLKEKIDKYTTN